MNVINGINYNNCAPLICLFHFFYFVPDLKLSKAESQAYLINEASHNDECGCKCYIITK